MGLSLEIPEGYSSGEAKRNLQLPLNNLDFVRFGGGFGRLFRRLLDNLWDISGAILGCFEIVFETFLEVKQYEKGTAFSPCARVMCLIRLRTSPPGG